jgi:hypothetical protein
MNVIENEIKMIKTVIGERTKDKRTKGKGMKMKMRMGGGRSTKG